MHKTMQTTVRAHGSVARACLLASLMAATFTGCEEKSSTEPMPEPAVLARQTVDDAGGTIPVPGRGLVLDIPPNALSAPTEIVVRESRSAPAGLVGDALELEPDGTVFQTPITLTIDIATADLPSDVLVDDVEIVTGSGSSWEVVPHRVRSTGDGVRVEALLSHFSTYAVITVDPTATLYGVYGFAPNDVYAYGSNAIVAHFDGTTITRTDIGVGVTTRLFDGWSAMAGAAHYVAGWDGNGRVWRGLAGIWSPEALPAPPADALGEPLVSIDGDDTTVITVGHGGRIVTRDGLSWTDRSYLVPGGPDGVVRRLRGVAALGGGNVVVVGDDIVLAGSISSLTEIDLSPVFGTNSWSLQGVWGRAVDDVYAVGVELDAAAARNVAVALHHDGATWTRTTLPPGLTGLRGVWGDTDEVVAVGNGGAILRMTGGLWSTETLCEATARALFDVWAVDGEFASAAGSGGVFLHPGPECAEEDDGSNGGGDPADATFTFDSVPVSGCDAGWVVGDVSFDVVQGDCGTSCGMEAPAGRIRIGPGRLRAIGSFVRVEVDVENLSGTVTARAWAAGKTLDLDTFSGTGRATLVVEVPISTDFYLADVDGCDFFVDEMRIVVPPPPGPDPTLRASTRSSP